MPRSRPPYAATTLGQYIRAARLGWGWSDLHQAWLRVSDCREGFCLEFTPKIATDPKGAPKTYRLWWEESGFEGMLSDLCEAAREVRGPLKQTVTLYVDDEGRLVRRA